MTKKIQKSNVKDIVELTMIQKGILFNSLKTDNTNLYNVQIVIEIKGVFDDKIFYKSVKEVQNLNDCLRSNFEWQKTSKPLQIILKETEINFNFFDYSQDETSTTDYILDDRRRGVDLKKQVPIRIGLIKKDKKSYELIISHHGILYDGWSTGILLKELFTTYNRINSGGKKTSKGNFKVDYKKILRENQEIQNKTETDDYWIKYLKNYEVKSLSKAPSKEDFKQFEQHTLFVPIKNLNVFTRKENVTKASIIYTTYGLLLQKYQNTSDVVFGTPVSNRNPFVKGSDEVMGNFVNMLPLRVLEIEEESILNMIKRVDKELHVRNEYSNSSYFEVKKAVQLEPNNDLFDSVLAVENYPLDFKSIKSNNEFNLELKSFFEHIEAPILIQVFFKERIEVVFQYDTTLFNAGFINAFSAHFKSILSRILDEPQLLTFELDCLPKNEKNILLSEFNATDKEYGNLTVLDLINSKTKENLKDIALVYEGVKMTYSELKKKSDALARYLLSEVVVVGSLVPICLDRSIEMVVGMLGILKAGCAYVPIDPMYPSQRIAYILNDIDARLVLTQDKYLERFAIYSKVRSVFIDTALPYAFRSRRKLPRVKPEDLIYVIYTSGTTGNPKGVMNNHAGVFNRLIWMPDYIGMSKQEVILQKTTFCFDVSAWEIFLPLTTGSCLVLAAAEGHTQTEYLQKVVSDEKISIMHFVPSMLSSFLLDLDESFCASLKHVICSGEELKPKQVRDFHSKLPSVKLYNFYGPTEASIEVAAINLNNFTGDIVPIGQPIANTHLYIVDRYNRLQPINVPGELCIGGVQVARGYLNRPELTAEKFVPSPFVEGERIYRTGDLGRWLPDGTIEFMGRKDNQVKIRGYRIELGEIESVLEQLDGIGGAAVLALDDSAGTKQLVGYIVPNGDAFDEALVIGSLQERLPDYMVPRIYIELDAFPLTVNGKVDRKALPAPDLSERAKGSYVPPTTAIERELVSIWEGILGISPIGVASNFFELGGDSIKAIQLMSRSNMAGLHFKVKDIFKYQTISELSRNLEGPREVISENGVLEGVLDLLPIQSEFFATGHAKSDHYNQSVLLEIPDTVTVGDLSKAVERLAFHHDALRLQYVLSDDEVVQSYGSSVPALIEERATKKRDITSICKEYQSSLDLVKGEVCRFVHVDMGKDRNRLFVVAHHLCVDGVSWRILLEDLESILQGLQKGKEVKLPAKGTSYRQWADRLKGYAQKISRSSEVGYWEDILSRYKEFPQDHNSDIALTYGDTAHHEQVLDSESTKSLLHDVHQAYGTEINDVLLSALGTALTGHSGSGEVVVAMEGHGREELFEDADIGRTVGWFTSMYPVLLKNHGDIAEQLKETKDMLRDVPNKGIGYGLLRYMSGDDGIRESLDVDYGSVLFNYLGSFDNSLDDEGLWGYAGDTRRLDINSLNTNKNHIAINGMIIDGKLRTSWSYDPNRYDAATVEGLAKGYGGALVSIIDHCRGRGREATRSDYGLPSSISNKAISSFLTSSVHNSQIMDVYGLSPLQEGMLFHSLYEEGTLSYVNHLSCDFTSELDITVFRKSWEYLIKCHKVLRTSIQPNHFDVPVQCVNENAVLPIVELDFRNLEGEALEWALQEYLSGEFQKDLDIREAPLFRFSLVHLPKQRTRLLLKYHHILWDGWSLSNLMGQFVQCYEAMLHGKSFPKLSFSDYGKFVRYVRSRDKAKAQIYWCEYLANLESGTFLPFVTDQQKRNKLFGNTFQYLNVDGMLLRKLTKYTKKYRLTMNTIVQGAWSYLLSRYTGSSTVVFGATVSGRDHSVPDIENEVGLYINTLPVCTDVPATAGLSSWLLSLQEGHTKGREEYGHVSLGDVQGWMDIQGPMFDSLLVFENYPLDKAITGNSSLAVENLIGDEYTNYVLTIGISQSKDRLSMKFDFNDTLLPHKVVDMVREHFLAVLESIVSGPVAVADLNYMPLKEKHNLLEYSNAVGTAYPDDRTMVDLFERQVTINPDSLAVAFQNNRYTYSEVNERANQLAHYLKRTYSIEANEVVGILLPKSDVSLIAILAILKTGGAYLPIDTGYPDERISYMIEDSELKVVLTNDEFSRLAESRKVLVLNTINTNKEKVGNLNIEISSCDLAYVIYTSGSTGRPKGVMIEHVSNVNMSTYQVKAFNVTNKDRVVWFASIAFDASVSELMMALYSGATLLIPTEGTLQDKEMFALFLRETSATIVTFPPSYLDLLSLEDISGLRCIITAGESARPKKAMDVVRAGIEYYNAYGPTECAVCVSTYEVSKENILGKKIPIGCPISNTSIYILDTFLRPVPIGVTGKIHVGGIGVARGYLNNEELTLEKFIPHPWQDAKRLYDTGDLGRWLPDGNIEFLGRIDDQIKVRGYRIELGEITSVMEEIPEIRQAVVLAHKLEDDSKILVGYFVLEEKLTISAIKKSLLKKLPEHMVPSYFEEIDSIPLTSNGKIDKKQLLKPKTKIEKESGPQLTNVEHKLLEIWSGLLGIEKKAINVVDNFFDLGGHSLSAINLINKIFKEFDVKVPLENVFEKGTVSDLAKSISNSKKINYEPIIPTKDRNHYVLSSAQKRMYFLYEFDSGSVSYNVPYVVKLKGLIDKSRLEGAFTKLIDRHESLRTFFEVVENETIQKISDQISFSLEYYILKSEKNINNVINSFIRPFDLDSPPLIRVGLLSVSSNEHLLLLDVHHIVTDGVSSDILVEDFMQLYDGKALPKLKLQYRDYAVWQQSENNQTAMSDQRDFWLSQFQEAPTPLNLPTDFPRPPIKNDAGASIDFYLNKEETDKLKLIGETTGATIFMSLLAIYNILLSKLSGEDDIVVGIPIAGRGHPDLEGMVGLFVNTLALRNAPKGEHSFNDFLKSIKVNLISCFSNQSFQYEELIDELRLRRDMSRSPLFDVLFSFQNTKESKLTIPGLELLPYDNSTRMSKFDLALIASEDEKGLSMRFEYAKILFKKETIERFANYFKNIVSIVTADHTIRLSNIDIVSKEEYRLLNKFGNMGVVFPKNRTIIDLFEDQVKKSRNEMALRYKENSISYDDLSWRSDVFASYLQIKYGIVKGDFVVVYMDYSLEMIVSLLGILKVGGVYVPVDANQPLDRLKFIVKDTECKIVFSSSHEWDKELSSLEVQVIRVDKVLCETIEEIPMPEPVVLSDEDLSYVIYTSGTTGHPKGVQINHGNFYSYLKGIKGKFFGGTQPILSSNGFDIFLFELFNPLLSGGCAVLLSNTDVRDMNVLLEVFKEINSFHAVPAFMSIIVNSILDNGTKESYRGIKELYIGGDTVPKHVLKQMRETFPEARIYVFYGPTEGTVFVTKQEYGITDKILDRIIGSPIGANQLIISDKWDVKCPLGVTGELCIGGVQVARGYLNRPELTAEKFVPSPFVEGERIYRTGDLGRWLPDGTIEFMGRKDNQVKIRGYRIELGEIESVLEQLDGIGGAAVLALDDSAGTKQLVGYIVPNGDAFDEALVIGSLQERLPDYMVPRIYIELDAFPLTVNGKVDRKALPAPDLSERAKGSYVPPTTAIERELVSIWEGILGISPIGVASNFFELGGDSIKAIQLMSRSNMAGLHFKVKDIFKYQTISELSRNLEGPREVISENGVLEGVLDLLPIQSEFFATGHAKSDHYNQSVLLEIPDTVTVGDLSKAVERLAFHHDALRLQYVLSDDEVVQSYGSSVPALIEERATKKRDITSICKEYQSSLDLVKGEVCRFVHVDMGKDRNRLFVVAHHLCVDGVSWRILLEDLESILQGLQKGKEVKLPAKGTSYRQWADRLKGYAQKISRSSEVGYWEDILSRYKEFPQDHNSDIALTYGDTAHHEQVLDSESTKSLLHDVHQAYGTEINDVLLSALGTALTGHSGSGEVVVAMEGHGREELFEDADIGRTVGWFTSMYPVLLKNHGDIAEQLKETKDMLRDVPNKGIGYGLLRYMSGDDVARGSLEVDYGSVLFNYLGSFDNSLDDQGLLGHSSDSRGEDIGISNLDPHGISVNGMIIDGELRTSWSYDPNRYDAATVEGLAKGYGGALVSIIDHCRGRGRETTRSDYGLSARIDNKSLSSFKAEMSKDVSPIVDIYGLSPLQEGMLFHNLYEDGSMSYVGRFNCDFLEGMDVDLFKQSWEHLMSHHSVLRTGIHADYFDTPVQYVHEAAPLSLTEVDYSNLGTEDLEQALESYMEAEYLKGFDLKEPPLFGFSLVHLPGGSTRLFMKSHHILWDGWSLSILMGQFVNCYDHLSKGDSLPVIRSSDYGRFVRELGSRDKTLTKSYWCSYLKELEGSVFLPFIKDKQDRNQVFGNVSDRLDLEKDLVKDLVSYAQRHRLTMNTIVQGAWSYLLSRYTGSSTVVFGATVSGRDHSVPDIENEVGLYINTLPVCTEVPYEEGLSSWLSSLQEGHTKGREEYGHVSLGDVQGWMDIQGPMFDSLLVFENYPVDEKLLGSTGLKVENVGMSESTNYVLTLGIKHAGEDLSIRFDYNDTLLDSEVVEMIKGHMRNTLKSMVSDIETLGEISYMDDRSRDQLLEVFGRGPLAPSVLAGVTILDLFSQQVTKTHDAFALKSGDNFMTYGELALRSDLLAGHLQNDLGVEKGDCIVVHIDRTFNMVVSLLALLKVGGVYVPVDLKQPSDRLGYILEDTGSIVLLSSGVSDSNLSFPDVHVVDVDVLMGKDLPKESLFSSVTLSGEDIAYVIYTSGSTGRPKGVKVSHGNLYSYLKGLEGRFITGGVQPILSSNGFDIFLFELLNPLLSGGCGVLLSDSDIQDMDVLLNVLKGVDSFHAVPAFMSAILEGISDRGVEEYIGIREFYIGGDSVPVKVLKQMRTMFPEAMIHEFYGPTEGTVFVTCQEYKASDEIPEISSSIGSPIGCNQILILDPQGNLCPIGVTGELYIGGAQVAQGYLNNVSLSSEKFVSDPFDPSGRLYRTGDLGRWLSDGTIEFMGRGDDQVKIRGYRIELGEIEAVLEQLDKVEGVVVLAFEDSLGARRLVSYMVFDGVFDETEVKEALRGLLPDYMIPGIYIELDKLPLTANGKVDRSTLPVPDLSKLEKDFYLAPQTAVEHKMASVWEEILGVSPIGVVSNFFELGGDSLRAMNLSNKIFKEFKVKVPLKIIFANKTLRALCQFIESLGKEEYTPIELVEKKEHYPPSSAQKRLYFLYEFDKDSLAYNMPLFLRLSGTLDKLRLERAFSGLIERHESLRTFFELLNGNVVQKIADHVPFDLDYYNLGKEEDLEIIIEGFIRPFDLGHAPLVRIGLVELSDHEHLLLLDMHHIITDSVSSGILIKDFMSLYNGDELPELNLHYKDYAAWQQSESNQKAITDQRKFWLDQFKKEALTISLPTDFRRPAVKSNEGDTIVFELSARETSMLKKVAKNESATLFMVLLAIFNVLLSKLSGEEDIVVGTPIAGRRHVDLDDMVGMFVNTLVLRNYPKGDLGFDEFLQELKTNTVSCFDNQDYQYEELIEDLQLERDTSHNPLFDVFFTLENSGGVELSISGLTLTPMDRKSNVSKFDLSMDVKESSDGLKVELVYSTNLFERSTIIRMANHYKTLISSVLEDRSILIGSMEMLIKSEHDQLLEVFGRGPLAPSVLAGVTILDLFSQQVTKTHDAFALKSGDNFMTYGELALRSDLLAGHLQNDLGVEKGDCIVVHIDRTFNMVVSLLALLKVGGVYVPVDLKQPSDRLGYILEDTGSIVLLSSGVSDSNLSFPDVHVVDVDVLMGKDLPKESLFSSVTLSGEDIAYVIYTSGSTGRPKGVKVSHGNLYSYLKGLEGRFITGGVQPILSSNGFDIFLFELLNPLLSGGCGVLLSDSDIQDMDVLLNVLKGVDSFHAVPAFMSAILEGISDRGVEEYIGIREFYIGGDSVPVKVLKQMRTMFPEAMIHEFYGPTEGTVFVTCQEYKASDEIPEISSSIGSPIGCNQILILDPQGNLCPIGVTGELYIGGAQVAQGYLNNVSLSSEKFVSDPFDPSGRLYRTGDLGRWLSDGTIEFMGRGDDQVKIRGYRIELGEIEAVLEQLDKVERAVILSKELFGDKCLVCYYLSDQLLTTEELYTHLALNLPEYMIPMYYQHMESFPMTSNGKINNKQLPIKGFEEIGSYVAPSNEIEEKLLELWAELLNMDNSKISINSNFFMLGGHSLKAMSLIVKLHNIFNIKISLREFFRMPTIKLMAVHIELNSWIKNMTDKKGDKKTIIEI